MKSFVCIRFVLSAALTAVCQTELPFLEDAENLMKLWAQLRNGLQGAVCKNALFFR